MTSNLADLSNCVRYTYHSAVADVAVEPVVVIERTSRLARPAAEVWARVTTPAGINHELAPWLQMTVPRGWSGSSLADVVAGTRLGRSWILALGLVPVDYDDLHIERIGDGYFREVSTMASAARWQHERFVEPSPEAGMGTCTVRDRVEFVPRRWVTAVPGGLHLHRAVIGALFRHRHRRLAWWSATV